MKLKELVLEIVKKLKNMVINVKEEDLSQLESFSSLKQHKLFYPYCALIEEISANFASIGRLVGKISEKDAQIAVDEEIRKICRDDTKSLNVKEKIMAIYKKLKTPSSMLPTDADCIAVTQIRNFYISKTTVIHIPQKCYAIITPETIKHGVVGAFASGLNNCAGIVMLACNEKTGQFYGFLCHADALTDLGDATHGIPGWIQKIPKDFRNVNIYCDGHEEFTLNSEGEKISCVIVVTEAVKKLRLAKDGKEALKINIISIDATETDLAVMANKEMMRNGWMHIYFEDDKKYNVEGSDFNIFVGNVIQNTKEDTIFPPICIFDGKRVFNTADIKQSLPKIEEFLKAPDEDKQSSTSPIGTNSNMFLCDDDGEGKSISMHDN